MVMGFKHKRENFDFERLRDPFFRDLDRKALKSSSATIYGLKPFYGDKFLVVRINGSLAGDYHLDDVPLTQFMRFSVAPMFGWKMNAFTSMAAGFGYGNSFGRHRILPLIAFNHTFNEKQGIEVLLPGKVKYRYSINPKTIVYAYAKAESNSYAIRLNDPVFEQNEKLFLRKTDFQFTLTLEREIHDWLWFSIESGVRSNINFRLNNDVKNRDFGDIIKTKVPITFLTEFSIFIVPPRKYYN